MMLKKYIPMILLVIVVVGLAFRVTGKDTRSVMLLDREFEIPEKYIAEAYILKWLKGITGFDETGSGILILFDGDELEQEIPGFKKYIDGFSEKVKVDIMVVMSVLTPKNIEYINSNIHFQDLWLAKGLYRDRYVIYDEEVGLYRVYSSKDITTMWDFTSISPEKIDPSSKIDDKNVIAGCSISNHFDGTKSYSCGTKAIFGDVVFQYHLKKENMKIRQVFNDFLRRKMEKWSVSK